MPDDPEAPSRRWRLLLALLTRLPQGAMSRAFGRLADLPLPPFARDPVIRAFARAVGANLDEAELPPSGYPSVNAFFTRRLRPGARSWPTDPALLASPVDGAIGQFGRIREGRIVQAKGRWYSVAEFTGGPAFEGGSFLTLYLRPKDYHRIHAPCGGEIASARHLPGSLLPVNPQAVAHVENLFPRNERLMCGIGGVLVVAVGAYNVGRISAAFDPEWATNRPGATPSVRDYDPPIRVRRGDEIMAFHLGSTVVLLLEPEWALDDGLQPGREVRVGDPLGALLRPSG